jgi:hypothetical protein
MWAALISSMNFLTTRKGSTKGQKVKRSDEFQRELDKINQMPGFFTAIDYLIKKEKSKKLLHVK